MKTPKQANKGKRKMNKRIKIPQPKPERTLEVEIARFGRGIKLQLEAMFKTWDTGLEYKKVFTKYARTAKSLGLSLDEFAYALQDAKFIRILMTPSGKRIVFASNCPWSDEEMQEHLQQLDLDARALASEAARRRYAQS
jgi:hypothetical protein